MQYPTLVAQTLMDPAWDGGASIRVSLSQNELLPFPGWKGSDVIELPSCSWLVFSRDGITPGDEC